MVLKLEPCACSQLLQQRHCRGLPCILALGLPNRCTWWRPEGAHHNSSLAANDEEPRVERREAQRPPAQGPLLGSQQHETPRGVRKVIVPGIPDKHLAIATHRRDEVGVGTAAKVRRDPSNLLDRLSVKVVVNRRGRNERVKLCAGRVPNEQLAVVCAASKYSRLCRMEREAHHEALHLDLHVRLALHAVVDPEDVPEADRRGHFTPTECVKPAIGAGEHGARGVPRDACDLNVH
mmetsp:Transcript_58709/g.188790  ORF Transcript_58709/g.188790 Transcript_58709/m.188790 type:complete len:235 (-) Transcript_58709:451-1155(-)